MSTAKQFFAHPTILSKSLDAEYYRKRSEEAAARGLKRKAKKEIPARDREIAADLRLMTQSAVMVKHRASITLIHRIKGDMDLKKL